MNSDLFFITVGSNKLLWGGEQLCLFCCSLHGESVSCAQNKKHSFQTMEKDQRLIFFVVALPGEHCYGGLIRDDLLKCPSCSFDQRFKIPQITQVGIVFVTIRGKEKISNLHNRETGSYKYYRNSLNQMLQCNKDMNLAFGLSGVKMLLHILINHPNIKIKCSVYRIN